MCGIAGFLRPNAADDDADRARLRRMVGALHHRGPDDLRALLRPGVALGHARLAIVDVEGGVQPMVDPASATALVFNGEVYNHVELRRALQPYAFRTHSDTEVLLAALLRFGDDCVERLNGQFAFAAWDPQKRRLTLARDPLGICPLFVVRTAHGVAFASEIKALVAGGFCDGVVDADGVAQALTLWAPLAPRTAVKGVESLWPGAVVTVDDAGHVRERRTFEPLSALRAAPTAPATWAAELRDTLDDAVALRLRADVPVGAYLSGGLDSSLICAMAQRQLGGSLRTFSVTFAEAAYDERQHQASVVAALGTDHRAVDLDADAVADALPAAVRHAEQPFIRTAPAPFLRLSRLARESGIRVVLTGEGADEFLLGYELYRETKIRAFWARQPTSTLRPRLLQRLYPYLGLLAQGAPLLRHAFGRGLQETSTATYSHALRFAAAGRTARLFAEDFRRRLTDDPIEAVTAAMPADVASGTLLDRAVWLEARLLLSGQLLSAQGDRMLMAGSVEGRFPFLDLRVVRLALSMPERVRLRGLDEKHVLKTAARGWVPRAVLQRKKFPYRAPAVAALLRHDALRDAVSPTALRDAGVFDAEKVALLLHKLKDRSTAATSEADTMALVGIVTTQLLTGALRDFRRAAPGVDDVVVVA